MSCEVMVMTGLSKERVAQYARSVGVRKVGRMYMWEDHQINGLISRIGKKGKTLDRS